MVTNNKDLRFIRQHEISFEPSDQWGELEEDDGRTEEYFLCRTEWLGILRVNKAQSKRKSVLLMFSDRPSAAIASGQALYFADAPAEEFCTVTSVS